ncbi:MAG: hypothetical protein ACFFB2_01700 [Promethearchaeota archaeon]
MGERIPHESQTTHIVFFNYSLCCLPSVDEMIGGLDEAWRVLTPLGILVNFYPFISPSQLFTQINTAEQMIATPIFESMRFDEGYAFKNAVILRGFELFTEEHITVKSFYSTQITAMEEILTRRSVEYLGFDQCLNYSISKMIGLFVTTQKKPKWFPFRKDDYFTLICQIFVKRSCQTKN